MPDESNWIATHHTVSAAERECLILLKAGATDREIASRLSLSLRAVQSRLQRFYERTSLNELDDEPVPVAHRRAGGGGRRAVAWANWHERCCLAGNLTLDAISITYRNV